jgi:uncharacterized protein
MSTPLIFMGRACLSSNKVSKEPESASTLLIAEQQVSRSKAAGRHCATDLILRNAIAARAGKLASQTEGDRNMAADTPHDLHSEFPEHAEALHDLKVSNAHFRTLSERHHDLNKAIHRIETGIDVASDERLEEMKKQRLALLDEIALMLNEHDTAH